MFYAVTGIGWGRGETAEEAEDNYVRAQKRNFPHLTDDLLNENWGFVWQAPEGATGFTLDSRLWWTFDDGRPPEEGKREQKVKPIGKVPQQILEQEGMLQS